MLTVGYEKSDGSVEYVETYDDTLQNLINQIIYQNIDINSFKGEEHKHVANKQEYFSEYLSGEEDTRFRFLKQKDGVWKIRDYYGTTHHDITFSSVKTGGKHRRTRRQTRRKHRN